MNDYIKKKLCTVNCTNAAVHSHKKKEKKRKEIKMMETR